MKKTNYLWMIAAFLMFISCNKYDDDIASIEERLDKIEGSSLTTIDQQITNINSSIDDLKGMDAELGDYIESLQTAVTDLQSKIDATNNALTALESDLEGQISASEQKVLNELNAVKTSLEGELAIINNAIATLQTKDTELDKKIIDLQTYADTQLANYATTDWAKATFATLTQYQDIQIAISAINTLIKTTQENITALEEKLSKKIADDIAAAVAGVNTDIAAKVKEITDAYTVAIQDAEDRITTAYTHAIKTAITATETSMKEWVNSVLAEGYYIKAEIDGKITALQTQVAEGDAELQKEIDDLKAALRKAESGLSAAYEQAIKDAVADGGIINKAIADAVNKAQDLLQAQINSINQEISKINGRLTELETNFAKRIQSLTYIPTYTDGKATMIYNTTSGKWEAELSFFVTPKSVVGNIKQEHLSAKGVYTAATRAVNLIDLSVTAFERDATNGTITVTVSGDNLTNFLSGMSNAAVFLIISDGNSEFVSDYVPLALKNYVIDVAANMSADDLEEAVSQALNDGERDFIITGNLTEGQQRAVIQAISEWHNNDASKNGTIDLTFSETTEICERLVDTGGWGFSIDDYGALALRKVYMPEATSAGIYAFGICSYVESVRFPKLETAGDECFWGLGEALSEYAVAEFPVLKTIGRQIFAGAKVETLRLPELTAIPSLGLDLSFGKIQNIVLPKVTALGQCAIYYTETLKSISFGSIITEMGLDAFERFIIYSRNVDLTLKNGQTDYFRDGESTGTLVEAGENKFFAGLEFKSITLVD